VSLSFAELHSPKVRGEEAEKNYNFGGGESEIARIGML
jgi:hypothetical protein